MYSVNVYVYVCVCVGNTVEPVNKGHYGQTIWSLAERLSRSNNTLKY